MYPENLKYHKEHTWLRLEEDMAYIGITDHAQNQLGEVLFVEMPEVGDEIQVNEEFGVVESSKVASELIAPVTGEVLEVNEKLDDEPEYINEAPYEAWIIKVKINDKDELEDLLIAEDYQDTLE